MKRKTLYSELQTSLRILENRKMMIPRYCDQSLHWNGHNHYTMDMIPALEKQIEELKAAIAGIEEWRKMKLIAKAPEMHQALKQCKEALSRVKNCNDLATAREYATEALDTINKLGI